MTNFKLIGLKLNGKTKNENGQSGKDCGELWQYFEENKIAGFIPNKISETIYAVYYDYEQDENGLFSYFIGCKVDENTEKPKSLDEIIIPQQNYHKETAKGQMTGCIADAWTRIWNSNLNRKFGFDFEVYDERSLDWNNAEIDIFISINN
ncbi:GyrI-like domain-containing protein [Albibacterium sp.]|uniref:GyrI-like domain-containing protein n=1 Tax=Albibacterium sp. TaxID=2952885 RepID=UPI002D1B0D8C|nr:GyrI-like domain-containing protein [Albibacterium sp.]HUH18774.1 GyrI-like domain-containing protein [Albibacterium sp.]